MRCKKCNNDFVLVLNVRGGRKSRLFCYECLPTVAEIGIKEYLRIRVELDTSGFFEKRATKVKANPMELLLLWKKQRGRCVLTGDKLSRETASLDHTVPISRGGAGTVDNLQWVTYEVNMAKHAMTNEEFRALCSKVLSRDT